MKKSLKFTRGKWVKCDSETTPTMAAQIAQLNRVVLHLGARITALESMHNNPAPADKPRRSRSPKSAQQG